MRQEQRPGACQPDRPKSLATIAPTIQRALVALVVMLLATAAHAQSAFIRANQVGYVTTANHGVLGSNRPEPRLLERKLPECLRVGYPHFCYDCSWHVHDFGERAHCRDLAQLQDRDGSKSVLHSARKHVVFL